MSQKQNLSRAEKLEKIGDVFRYAKEQLGGLIDNSRFRKAVMNKLESAETSASRAMFVDRTRFAGEPDAEVPA